VDLIVEGSVARAGNRVRVTAQLIDARSDARIWARSYDRTLRDVLALQGEVATAIARQVRGAITPRQQERLSGRKPVDPAVYDSYLRGRHAWNLRTTHGFETAVQYFTEAVGRDPQFALGQAGLADALVMQGSRAAGPNTSASTLSKAKSAALRAIEWDGGLAEAHTSVAAALFFGERNLEAAKREFRLALELNAGYPTANQWYAVLLAEQRRDAEATKHAQQAVKLDPLSGTMRQTLGLVHYYARRYPEAVAEERRALELAPQLTLARSILAKALLLQGQTMEAIAVCERAPAPRAADMLVLGLAQLRAGHRAAADAVLKELREQTPTPIAAIAQWRAATGNHAEAFEMLNRLLGTGSLPPGLKIDPLFDSFRADSRFAELERRAKL
jgi:tetratricopeptide (TPR) repeat protein